MMRWLALVLSVCTGCDVVLGLDDHPAPCSQASFAQAMPARVMNAEQFSIAWDQSRAVVIVNGQAMELSPLTGTPTRIDLGPYTPTSLGLSPEGDSLLFTADIEPPTLHAAVGGGTDWRLDSNVPVGTYAGTPSADAFGPRRVLVRIHRTGMLQEYEDDNGLWKPVGDPQPFDGQWSANLTPNGLTMVYTARQMDSTLAVMMATRTSMSQAFGPASVILPGDHAQPQLLDQCKSLYVIDPGDPAVENEPELNRYDR